MFLLNANNIGTHQPVTLNSLVQAPFIRLMRTSLLYSYMLLRQIRGRSILFLRREADILPQQLHFIHEHVNIFYIYGFCKKEKIPSN